MTSDTGSLWRGKGFLPSWESLQGAGVLGENRMRPHSVMMPPPAWISRA